MTESTITCVFFSFSYFLACKGHRPIISGEVLFVTFLKLEARSREYGTARWVVSLQFGSALLF